MLIDHYLERFDFVEQHKVLIGARPDLVYRSALNVNFADESLIIRSLLWLRGMSTEGFSLDRIEQSNFKKLDEDPGHELVLGIVGRFWTIFGGLQKIHSGDEFRNFETPGYAKAVWNFSVEESNGRTCLSTETRIRCIDDASRRSFGRYWTLIRPFSGLIRIKMLNEIKRKAEAAAGSSNARADRINETSGRDPKNIR